MKKVAWVRHIIVLQISLFLIVGMRLASLDLYIQQMWHKDFALTQVLDSRITQALAQFNHVFQVPVDDWSAQVSEQNTAMVERLNTYFFAEQTPVAQSNTSTQASAVLSVEASSAVTLPVTQVPASSAHKIVASEAALMTKVDQAATDKVKTLPDMKDKADASSALSDTRVGLSSRRVGNKLLMNENDRVLLVGDSMMQGVAPFIARKLNKEHQIKSWDASKQSTGLAYPNYFNWPKKIQELVQEHQITTLIVYLGANDTWDLVINNKYERYGTDAWHAEYASRIRSILNFAQEKNIEVIWLGVPSMGKPKLKDRIEFLGSLMQKTVQAQHALYISTHDIVGDGTWAYTKYLNVNDRKVTMRSDDGVHFTPAGQKKIAEAVLNHMQFAEKVVENVKQP